MYVYSDVYFEDDCFDSPWMLESTLTYSDRFFQRHPHPRAVPTKFPRKPVKEQHFLKQREETHHKRSLLFLFIRSIKNISASWIFPALAFSQLRNICFSEHLLMTLGIASEYFWFLWSAYERFCDIAFEKHTAIQNYYWVKKLT